jgi:hypothetical protein
MSSLRTSEKKSSITIHHEAEIHSLIIQRTMAFSSPTKFLKPSIFPPLVSQSERVVFGYWGTGIKFKGINLSSLSLVPPSFLKPPEFICALPDIVIKYEFPPDLFHSKLNEILTYFTLFQRIYIDGSKASAADAAMSNPKLPVNQLSTKQFIYLL